MLDNTKPCYQLTIDIENLRTSKLIIVSMLIRKFSVFLITKKLFNCNLDHRIACVMVCTLVVMTQKYTISVYVQSIITTASHSEGITKNCLIVCLIKIKEYSLRQPLKPACELFPNFSYRRQQRVPSFHLTYYYY